MRNAISRTRSRSVCARNSISSKIVASGQNVIVVPRFFDPRDALELVLRLAALRVVLLELAAVAVDLELEPARQRVDDGHADAVQTAGDLVALAAELPAGVQHREHDLRARLVGVLGVRVDGDAAPVVDDATATVGEQGDVDLGAFTGHGLVDGVVDDLVDEVVQPGGTGRSDVHPGPLADGFEALENGDVLGVVRHACRYPSMRWDTGGPWG